MKKFIYSVTALLCCYQSGYAAGDLRTSINQAKYLKEPNSYVVFDAGALKIKVDEAYGSIIHQQWFAMNLGAGYLFNDIFGMELGFCWNDGRAKEFTSSTTTNFLGVMPTLNSMHTAKIGVNTTYADIYYNFIKYKNFRPFISLGVAFVQPRFKFKHTVSNNISTMLDEIKGKTQFLLRPSVGVEISFNESIGLRFMYRYAKTSMVSVGPGTSGLPVHPFMDSSYFSAGISIKFN